MRKLPTDNIIPHNRGLFQQVKGIPFSSVVDEFYQMKKKANKIICPFHSDKNPSLHVYEDGFKCFACGEYGDSVDLIAALYNFQLLEAAKFIAERFGLVSHSEVNGNKKNKTKTTPVNYRKALKIWQQRAFLRAVRLKEIAEETFRVYSLDIPDAMVQIAQNKRLFS